MNDNAVDVTVVSKVDARGYVSLVWARPEMGPPEAPLTLVIDWARCQPTFPGARRLTVEFLKEVW